MFCDFPSTLPQIYMPMCVDPDFAMQHPGDINNNFLMRAQHPANRYCVETTDVETKINSLSRMQ